MSFDAQLNLTATVERATESVGDSGEVSLAWAVQATGVPCALQARGVAERQTDAGLRRETSHVAWFPADADVRPTTQGGIGDRVLIDGARYRVLHVTDVASRGRMLRAELKREV